MGEEAIRKFNPIPYFGGVRSIFEIMNESRPSYLQTKISQTPCPTLWETHAGMSGPRRDWGEISTVISEARPGVNQEA